MFRKFLVTFWDEKSHTIKTSEEELWFDDESEEEMSMSVGEIAYRLNQCSEYSALINFWELPHKDF